MKTEKSKPRSLYEQIKQDADARKAAAEATHAAEAAQRAAEKVEKTDTPHVTFTTKSQYGTQSIYDQISLKEHAKAEASAWFKLAAEGFTQKFPRASRGLQKIGGKLSQIGNSSYPFLYGAVMAAKWLGGKAEKVLWPVLYRMGWEPADKHGSPLSIKYYWHNLIRWKGERHLSLPYLFNNAIAVTLMFAVAGTAIDAAYSLAPIMRNTIEVEINGHYQISNKQFAIYGTGKDGQPYVFNLTTSLWHYNWYPDVMHANIPTLGKCSFDTYGYQIRAFGHLVRQREIYHINWCSRPDGVMATPASSQHLAQDTIRDIAAPARPVIQPAAQIGAFMPYTISQG